MSLIAAMRAASNDRSAQIAISAHRELRMHEPTIEEIASYRKNDSPIIRQAVQKSVESLLSLRSNTLVSGPLLKERRGFQEDVEKRLNRSVKPKKRLMEEYAALAHRFSRLLAAYYVDEECRQPDKIQGRLSRTLPYLAGHLLAELELCLESRFVNLPKSLCKVSVFDIQEKLDVLEHHPDKVVRRNARTIICVALNNGDFALADSLARNAREKLEMLQNHFEPIVRDNAHVIIDAALRKGHLELADTLSQGAKAKLDMLENHPDPHVRDNARTILCAAFRRGDLGIVDKLAQGASKAFADLKKRLGADAKDIKTRFSQMMNMATLDAERFLKRMTFVPQ